MNIIEKFGMTPIIGTAGALGTWSISIINEYVAFAIGLCTLIYTCGKCVQVYSELKEKSKKRRK